MPKFIVRNNTNQFDTTNGQSFATQEEADAAARQVLATYPTHEVWVLQVMKEYSAKVSITAKDPATPEPAPEPESPTA